MFRSYLYCAERRKWRVLYYTQLPPSRIHSKLLASREPSLNRDFTHTHTQTYINFKGLSIVIKIRKFIPYMQYMYIYIYIYI